MPNPKVFFAGWFMLTLLAGACSDPPNSTTPFGGGGSSGTGGAAGGSVGGSGGTAGSGTAGSGTAGSGTAGSGTAGSGTAGSGTAGSGSAGSGGSGTAGSGTAGSGTGGTAGSGTDPFEANRQACVDKINALRATMSLPAYNRWKSAESCVDQQASHDAEVGIPHDAFSKGTPSCGSAQNECPGWGADGVVGCLQSMWDERLQPGCSGCDACDTYAIFQGNCPNCMFNGTTVCGHYVNMSAKVFSNAACGFSATNGWAAINFQ